jgi:hypothetical protein
MVFLIMLITSIEVLWVEKEQKKGMECEEG